MNSIRTLITGALALSLAGVAHSAPPAATTPAAPKAEHADTGGKGWQSLFGENLEQARFNKEVWSQQGGVLTATQDQVIWSKQKWGDCVIDLEFKNAAGTNSGVIIRCSNTDQWVPNSMEVQIADDFAGKWAKSPKTWQCGAIFGRLAATESVVRKPGEWNRYTITCEGPIIEVVLNGRMVTRMDSRKWVDAHRNPDGSETPAHLKTPASKLEMSGHIGLQGKHGDAPIWFRNVRIKPLGATE